MKGGNNPVQRLVPAHRGQVTVGVAGQRCQQTVGVNQSGGGSPALDAEGALVNREGVIAGNLRGFPGARQPHSALEGTVGTMGGRFD